MDRAYRGFQKLGSFLIFLAAIACQDTPKSASPADPEPVLGINPPPETELSPSTQLKEDLTSLWTPFDQSPLLRKAAGHPRERMHFKRIQSLVRDKNEIFAPLYPEVQKMSPDEYSRLTPLILERDIEQLQEAVRSGELCYESLTRYFLKRIYRYELDSLTTLNTVIELNSGALRAARQRDEARSAEPDRSRHPLFGMPVLLKDNIGADGMSTTAGAEVLLNNNATDAFIVSRLRETGAIILGKVNLSEWAYYFCGGCPVGYSAVGGQTLNPYGRGVFETGGSSSGSGTAVAAGYAVAAVGTETSGSILSPSGQNSVVGIKPTVGLLSRTGIVPISSTLDTPGPMARSVADAGILLEAMMGYDEADQASVNAQYPEGWYYPEPADLQGIRLGVFPDLLERDSLYRKTTELLASAGAILIPFEPTESELKGFTTLLNLDMKNDLPEYVRTQVRDTAGVRIQSVADVVRFNARDSNRRALYGQRRFEGILQEATPRDSLPALRTRLQQLGRSYFEPAFGTHRVQAVLSIDNYHASYAAVAHYPALTLPMGYRESGEPTNLTLIARRFQEPELLEIGLALEQLTKARQWPKAYAP